MDQTTQQQTINKLLDTSQTQNQEQINQVIEKLQPQIKTVLIIAAVYAAVVIIILLINSIFKWRVDRAFFRMDKNLQKLVELQVGAENKVVSTDIKQVEQI